MSARTQCDLPSISPSAILRYPHIKFSSLASINDRCNRVLFSSHSLSLFVPPVVFFVPGCADEISRERKLPSVSALMCCSGSAHLVIHFPAGRTAHNIKHRSQLDSHKLTDTWWDGWWTNIQADNTNNCAVVISPFLLCFGVLMLQVYTLQTFCHQKNWQDKKKLWCNSFEKTPVFLSRSGSKGRLIYTLLPETRIRRQRCAVFVFNTIEGLNDFHHLGNCRKHSLRVAVPVLCLMEKLRANTPAVFRHFSQPARSVYWSDFNLR